MGSKKKRPTPQNFIQPQRCIRSSTGINRRPDPEIIINAKNLSTILNTLEGFSE